MNSIEKLAHLKELLALEKEEDVRLFREMVLRKSLKQRTEKGTTWYPLHILRMYYGIGDRLMVELQHLSPPKKNTGTFQSGSVVSLFGMQGDQTINRLTGVISGMKENMMRIALGIDYVPDWFQDTRLGVDLEFDDKTYLEMNRALERVMNPDKEEERLRELREALIGKKTPGFERNWEVTYANPTLNDSQNRAVQRILEARDVAIVHGPPGTGKTTTLVQAIKEVLLHEHQVLVCAPSNTAVDLLTLRCATEGLSVVRLGNPARVDEDILDLTLDGRVMQHDDYGALKKLRKDAEEARSRAVKFKRKYGSREQQRRRQLLRDSRELKQLSRQLEDFILHQVLHRSQVLLTTLTGAANSNLKNKHFHTVFIDEAGQALTPAMWIPLLKANRVIMAGDHHQLPPTVKSQKADKQGLSKTLFEEVIEAHPHTAVMLETQYRMHDHIMRFSGQMFYDNKLVADAGVASHLLGEGFEAIEFVDTAGCGFTEQKNPDTLSTFNTEEAQLLLRHLAMLFIRMEKEIPAQLNDSFNVGIIAPYKQQVKTLARQLAKSPLLESYTRYVTVNTVDGFQGQERDVIYISLTRSNKKGEVGFLKDIRRMNVALTRARKKLVVIGDSATLGNHPFYEDFFKYAESLGAYRSAYEFAAE